METLGAIQAEDIRGFRLATLLDPTTPEFPSNSKRKRGVRGILDNDQFTAFWIFIEQVSRPYITSITESYSLRRFPITGFATALTLPRTFGIAPSCSTLTLQSEAQMK